MTAPETPQTAARRFAKEPIANGFEPEALHEYVDEAGNILYWRIRLKHPQTGEKWIRPMKLATNQQYILGEPEFPHGKPLYNLKSILSAPLDTLVIVCEGEWCVDQLKKLGVLATASGGADSAAKADWTPLANRTVIIWPDNDKAGQHFLLTVANELKKLGCILRQVDVNQLNLPEKGDVVDWLKTHPTATSQDIAAIPSVEIVAPVLIEPNATKENIQFENSCPKQNQISLLVEFVKVHTKLFHDQNSEVYVQDLVTRETRRLDSRAFKDWLLAQFYVETGKSPRDQSIREALSILSGLGRHKGECHDVHVRVAQAEGAYFLDLGEPNQSRAVRIVPGHWEIITDPPVYFLRTETMRSLPLPTVGGNLSALWDIVNIAEADRLLVIAWLVECLRPDTPFPILELIGEQGSAKSTTQAMLRGLIDPNTCDLRAAPKAVEDIFVSASVNWLVSYENISHLSSLTQDALCILATGGGFAKRKLYTDTGEAVITVKRPVVLNGIGAAVTAQDLIDRTISIETPLITQRMQSTDLWHTYRNAQANFLGALLTIFSDALARLSHIKLPTAEHPRLVEFVHLGMAIAESTGRMGEDFLEQFKVARQEAIARTIDASPVASALIEWFEDGKKYPRTLPIKRLFVELEKYKPNGTDAWPRSAKGFADALRRAAPALRHMGIECHSLGKTGGYISWEIKATLT